MTALIEKIAFMPPRRAYAERVLKDRVGYVTSRLGHRVSYLDLLPSNPGRCIPAGGEGQPCSHSDPSRKYSGAPFSPLYTMLYAHGNAEDLAYGCRDLTFLANKLGIRIVPYDYPGYGLSEPIKPTEEAAEAAEEAMFEYLTNEVGIPRNRIIVAGRSLGGGPSTWLASRQPGLAALILICTFTSCAAVAGKAASVVARGFDVFPSIRRIGKIKDFPILIVHGDADSIVPYEHGKALYKEALSKNKTHVQLLTLPGCGHNNIEFHSGPTFWSGTRGFIETVVARRTALQAYAAAGVEPPATLVEAIRPAAHPKQMSQAHQQDRMQFRQYISGGRAQQPQQQQAAAGPQPGVAQTATPQTQQSRQHPHHSSLEQQWHEQQQQGQPQQQPAATVLSADVFNNPDLLMQHVLAQHHAALGMAAPGTSTTTRHVFSNTPGTGVTSHLQPSVTAATGHFTSQRSGAFSSMVNQPLQPPMHQQQQQYQQAAHHMYYGQAGQGPMTPWDHGIAAPTVVDQQQQQQQYHQYHASAAQQQQPQQQAQYARTVPMQPYLQPGAGWGQQGQQSSRFVLDPATGAWQQR